MSLAILFCDWEVLSLGCVTIRKAKKEDFQHLSSRQERLCPCITWVSGSGKVGMC